MIEYWHAGKAGDTRFAKIPGRVKYENITLKGGVTQDSKKLWDWRKHVQDGRVDDARQNGTVWMFDQANTPVASWKFEGAWPVSLKGPAMNAGNNEVGVEELQIAIEYLERMQ